MDEHTHSRIASPIVAAGVGALLMYFLDPDHGRQRMDMVRGKVSGAMNMGREQADTQMHDLSGRVSSMVEQGRSTMHEQTRRLQQNMPQGQDLAMLIAGAGLALFGLGRRTLPSGLLGAAGAMMAVRALKGQGGSMHAGGMVEVEKTIFIDAPREQVFDLWSNYENFPQFMSLVEEVRQLDERRSHWVVKGPAGARIEWDSVLTQNERPGMLAWRSEEGSPIQHAGSVRLEDEGGGTRATVRMSYHPPAGVVGHTVASLLGRDPKHGLDQDLMRMKRFIEGGKSTSASTGSAKPLAGATAASLPTEFDRPSGGIH